MPCHSELLQQALSSYMILCYENRILVTVVFFSSARLPYTVEIRDG